MTKFPVVRDLMVNRRRLFRSLEKVKAWVPVDGYYDLGPGPRQSFESQQQAYPLSECMGCGCCLDACPQYVKVELTKREGESDADFAKRERQAHDENFVGAMAISQAIRFNSDPTGKMNADDDDVCAWGAGALDERGRRRRRDGVVSGPRGHIRGDRLRHARARQFARRRLIR